MLAATSDSQAAANGACSDGVSWPNRSMELTRGLIRLQHVAVAAGQARRSEQSPGVLADPCNGGLVKQHCAWRLSSSDASGCVDRQPGDPSSYMTASHSGTVDDTTSSALREFVAAVGDFVESARSENAADAARQEFERAYGLQVRRLTK